MTDRNFFLTFLFFQNLMLLFLLFFPFAPNVLRQQVVNLVFFSDVLSFFSPGPWIEFRGVGTVFSPSPLRFFLLLILFFISSLTRLALFFRVSRTHVRPFLRTLLLFRSSISFCQKLSLEPPPSTKSPVKFPGFLSIQEFFSPSFLS